MVSFTISEADHLEAVRLATRLDPKKYRHLVLATLGAALIAGWILDLEWPGLLAGTVGGVLGGLLANWSFRRWLLPRRARSLYRQNRALQEPFHLSWDEHGPTFRNSLGTATTPWSHYHAVREGPTVFQLMLTDHMYHVVPKAALGDALDRFRSALNRIGA